MAKLLSSLTLIFTLSAVLAHGPQDLEKHGMAACGTAYKPVPAGKYPDMDCTPFVQDPQVQEWLKLVDFKKVPVYPQSKNGVCPEDLTKIPKDQCWWTCQKCDASEDITTCPKAKTWGLTYDGMI